VTDRSPPTPPGMRVRTGRLKRLRSPCLYPNMTPGLVWPQPGRSGSSLPQAHQASPAVPFMTSPVSGHLKHIHLGWSGKLTLPLLWPFVGSPQLLWPLLTSRSGFHRHLFRHEARSPQVRTHSFPAQPPDLRRLILDHKSFAVSGPLALIGSAFYPVLVHRLAVSIHASFPRSVTLPQLRFTSFAVVSSREDLHLRECAHAGRTRKRQPQLPFRETKLPSYLAGAGTA